MTDINITQRTQRLIVDAPTKTVSVINAGPQGPAGPVGEVSLAQHAEKLDKAGDTLEGDLNFPDGIRPQFQWGGNSEYYFYQPADGVLNFRGTASRPGSPGAANLIKLEANNSVDMSNAVLILVPSISGTSQAAQVTGYDATTGQLQIGGVEIGDTGWRDVSGDLENGWAGSLLVRRTANITWIRPVDLDGSAASASSVYSLPVGFRELLPGVLEAQRRTMFVFNSHNTGSPTESNVVYAGLGGGTGGDFSIDLDQSDIAGVNGFQSIPNSGAWPTTLPGVAA